MLQQGWHETGAPGPSLLKAMLGPSGESHVAADDVWLVHTLFYERVLGRWAVGSERRAQIPVPLRKRCLVHLSQHLSTAGHQGRDLTVFLCGQLGV